MIGEQCQYTACSASTLPEGGPVTVVEGISVKSTGIYLGMTVWRTALDSLDIFQVAETLRPGGGHFVTPVELNVNRLPVGRFNLHVPIVYDDGVRWIARIRQNRVDSLPSLVERHVVKGEIDTTKWLSSCGAAPVPKVMSPIMTKGDAIFYFLELVPGHPCPHPIWAGDKPQAEVIHIIRDYAAINVRRSQHPLPLVGSIHLDEVTGTYTVGPLITADNASPSPPLFPGPWRTAAGKYECLFDRYLADIKAGNRYPFERRKAFLIFSWMKEAVMAYEPYNVEGENFVVHEDSNGGHIMVEEGRIVGLIDWERASVGPLCEAFATPQCFEGDLIDSGSNELSWAELELADEYRRLGREDLADNIAAGRPFQWMSILIGNPGAWCDYRYIKALGESLGLRMKESFQEFMTLQKRKYREELYEAFGRQEKDGKAESGQDMQQLLPLPVPVV